MLFIDEPIWTFFAVFILYFLGERANEETVPQDMKIPCSWPDFFSLSAVHNVLSQETISNCISLPDDIRKAIFGDDHHDMSGEPRRVQSFAAWGVQTFTSGRHYWEVDVPQSSNWILGVCKDSSISDTDITIDFAEEAVLLMSLKRNNHYCLSTNPPPLIQYVKKPLGKIGVFLDYDNGTVSFYDADKGSLIACIVSSYFHSPLKPFLCLGSSWKIIFWALFNEIPCLRKLLSWNVIGGSRTYLPIFEHIVT